GTVALPAGVTRDDYEYLVSRQILIPVANARLARIPDSFGDMRGGKRVHGAVDIMAPRGTPVLAADDGKVLKMRKGGAGGITLYALEPRERFVYYYAHLDHYRKGLGEGDRLRKGDTLGFVGTTGNAPRDVPHLHFQIMRMPADRRWWAGVPVNPRPLFSEQPSAVRAENGERQ
ncbi:MAG TPA: M23 family metallopeptidase, partial [Gemmatimonadaceae bacterium]|nr:M23 family metallopeptidase [Gemmatimonadaceae bacterium]